MFSLLNVIYKILSKAIANHIKSYLPNLVHEDQTGLMAGCDISTNIRKVIDVIQYTKHRNVTAIILSLDFKKCFDKIVHTTIEDSMKYFNFGKSFIYWVMILYKDIQACTLNSGHLSN